MSLIKSTVMMGAKIVSETFDCNSALTRLNARRDWILFSHTFFFEHYEVQKETTVIKYVQISSLWYADDNGLWNPGLHIFVTLWIYHCVPFHAVTCFLLELNIKHVWHRNVSMCLISSFSQHDVHILNFVHKIKDSYNPRRCCTRIKKWICK